MADSFMHELFYKLSIKPFRYVDQHCQEQEDRMRVSTLDFKCLIVGKKFYKCVIVSKNSKSKKGDNLVQTCLQMSALVT